MLSCSLQNVLLSLLLSRHIHNIFTVSVHRAFEPHDILKLLFNHYLKRERGWGKGSTGSTGLSSWHRCTQTPDMTVACPL